VYDEEILKVRHTDNGKYPRRPLSNFKSTVQFSFSRSSSKYLSTLIRKTWVYFQSYADKVRADKVRLPGTRFYPDAIFNYE